LTHAPPVHSESPAHILRVQTPLAQWNSPLQSPSLMQLL
jgi:hypothetical protein